MTYTASFHNHQVTGRQEFLFPHQGWGNVLSISDSLETDVKAFIFPWSPEACTGCQWDSRVLDHGVLPSQILASFTYLLPAQPFRGYPLEPGESWWAPGRPSVPHIQWRKQQMLSAFTFKISVLEDSREHLDICVLGFWRLLTQLLYLLFHTVRKYHGKVRRTGLNSQPPPQRIIPWWLWNVEISIPTSIFKCLSLQLSPSPLSLCPILSSFILLFPYSLLRSRNGVPRVGKRKLPPTTQGRCCLTVFGSQTVPRFLHSSFSSNVQ